MNGAGAQRARGEATPSPSERKALSVFGDFNRAVIGGADRLAAPRAAAMSPIDAGSRCRPRGWPFAPDMA